MVIATTVTTLEAQGEVATVTLKRGWGSIAGRDETRTENANRASAPQSFERSREPLCFIQLGIAPAAQSPCTAAGLGAGGVGTLKLARFLRTLSRLLTFIGCCCTMGATAVAS